MENIHKFGCSWGGQKSRAALGLLTHEQIAEKCGEARALVRELLQEAASEPVPADGVVKATQIRDMLLGVPGEQADQLRMFVESFIQGLTADR